MPAYGRYCWSMSRDFVDHSWCRIQALAAALLERQTITYVEMKRLLFDPELAAAEIMRNEVERVRAINESLEGAK